MAVDMMGLILGQFGIKPEVMRETFENLRAHHDEMVQAIRIIHERQEVLIGKVTMMESMLHELVPHPDGSTYEQMNPANYPVVEANSLTVLNGKDH